MPRLPASPWTTFCYAMVALASLTGSLITLLGFLGAVVALVHLLRGRAGPPTKAGRALALAMAGYFAILATTTALNGPDLARFIELVLISPFLYFVPLALVLPQNCPDFNLRALGRAAMIGVVPTALLTLWASLVMGVYRPELAPGNANVLSGLLVLQAALCLGGWQQAGRRERAAILASIALACFAVLIGAGSRGAFIALVLLALVGAALVLAELPRARRRAALLAVLAIAALAGVLMGPTFAARLQPLLVAAFDPSYGDWITSTGSRLTMYKAALATLADHPWIGVGMHQRFDATLPYYAVPPPDYIYYTHVHNLLLTHGTAGGLPAILAVLWVFAVPVVTVLRQNDAAWGLRWLGLSMPVGVFALGLTETVLFHDLNITVTLFSFVLVAIASEQARAKTNLAKPPKGG